MGLSMYNVFAFRSRPRLSDSESPGSEKAEIKMHHQLTPRLRLHNQRLLISFKLSRVMGDPLPVASTADVGSTIRRLASSDQAVLETCGHTYNQW